MRMPSSGELKSFYFLSGAQGTAASSYVWRLGSRSTSFYVKPQYNALAALKISLHGPDPRPGLTPGFRFGIDQSATSLATVSGGSVVQKDLPNGERWFEGEDVEGRARRAIRFRLTSDLFGDKVPSA